MNEEVKKRAKAWDVSIGDRYGRWLVTGVPYRERNKTYVPAICDCGKELSTRLERLKAGKSLSCGCLSKELVSMRSYKHGRVESLEYKSWCMMKSRCTNKTYSSYEYYGGRGIIVCERWMESFDNFFADMGERPHGTSLERIDNEKGYDPENCVWATRYQQSRNKRTTGRISFNGKILCVIDAAKESGIKPAAIYNQVYVRRVSHQEAFDYLMEKRNG